MKSFTRVLLPILLVFGVVAGITYVQLYSDPDTPTEGPRDAQERKTANLGPPLKFFTLKVAAPRMERGEDGEVRVARHLLHLKYWEPDVEVGAPGHYDFWCQNRHPEPVTVRVQSTNCQCAGVEMALVPTAALKEYTAASALAAGPLSPAAGPAAALAHVLFERQLKWVPLNIQGDRHDQIVPAAAGPADPQFALIRLSWSGKDPVGPKNINADVYYSLPDGVPSAQRLEADISVVPAFYPIRRSGPSTWAPVTELAMGDLGPGTVSTQEFFLASSTRSQLLYKAAADPADPGITVSDPVPASPAEWASLTDFIHQERKAEDDKVSLRRPKSLYKVKVTVRERTEVLGEKDPHHLDLGPLDRKLMVSAADGGAIPLPVRGRVHGEVRIRTGSSDGRIDLGNSFSAAEDRSKDVILLADRPGLDLTLMAQETRPNYLRVKLDPLEPVGGRKQWRLRVTVPKGSLYGALPEDSGVLLKTNDPVPRRFRLPVRGMTYDSGGPRL
jgi:hypothetical protein